MSLLESSDLRAGARPGDNWDLGGLMSILALPAAWVGREPEAILQQLLGALEHALEIDLAYASWKQPDQERAELLHVSDKADEATLRAAVRSAVQRPGSEAVHLLAFADPPYRLLVCKLGLDPADDYVAVAARRAAFPSALDKLILGIAANQAAVAMHEARLRAAQAQMADQLERDVKAQTRELAAANEALRRENAERRSVEETLTRSQAYLAEAERLAHVGTWAYDVARRVPRYWSAERCRMSGLDPNSGPPPLDAERATHTPEDWAHLMATVERAIASGQDFTTDSCVQLPDGTTKQLHIVGHPVLDADGNVVELVGVTMDVTAARQAAALLSAEKHLVELIAQCQPLHVVLLAACRAIEELCAEATAAVMVQDAQSKRLQHVTSISLPEQLAADLEQAGSRGWRLADIGSPEPALHDLARTRDWEPHRDEAQHHGYRAVWTVALAIEGMGSAGQLCVFLPQVRSPDAREASTIEAIAHIIVTALERERGRIALSTALSDLESERDRLRVLLELSNALIASHDLPGLLQAVAGSLRKATGCACVGLALPDAAVGLREHLVDFPDSKGAIRPGMVVPLNGSASGQAYRTRRPVSIGLPTAAQGDPAIYGTPEGREFYELLLRDGVPTGFFLPLIHHDHVIAVLQLARYDGVPLRAQTPAFLNALAAQLALAVANALAHGAVVASRDQLASEQEYLREEIDRSSMFEEIVGGSPSLAAVLVRVGKVAPTDSSVLITGETGTGKELIARAIHKRSARVQRPFICINCAAIPSSLISAELFGHEKGAFTGAQQRRLGRFELAQGGTLFLDEVGELPPETQIALLRVLQEHAFERVGGAQPITTDVRLIAATNRDLAAEIASGRFRSDLYYRLNVFPIELPPLRARSGDVRTLTHYFIDRFCKQLGKRVRAVSAETLGLFEAYDWPGNIRELQNVIERSLILCDSDTFSVDASWLPTRLAPPSHASGAAAAGPNGERERIEAALRATRGRVAGPSGAALRLGMPPSTLESKIRALKINKHIYKSV